MSQHGNSNPLPGGGFSEQVSAKSAPAGGLAGDQASPETRRRAHLNPGDELPAGAPGAGENVCRSCGGKGRLDADRECPDCGGSGRVIESVAGGP